MQLQFEFEVLSAKGADVVANYRLTSFAFRLLFLAVRSNLLISNRGLEHSFDSMTPFALFKTDERSFFPKSMSRFLLLVRSSVDEHGAFRARGGVDRRACDVRRGRGRCRRRRGDGVVGKHGFRLLLAALVDLVLRRLQVLTERIGRICRRMFSTSEPQPLPVAARLSCCELKVLFIIYIRKMVRLLIIQITYRKSSLTMCLITIIMIIIGNI